MSAKPDIDFQGMMQQFFSGATASKARTLPGWWNSIHYQQTMTFEHCDIINFAKSALFAACLTQGGTVMDTRVWVEESKIDSPAGSIEEFARGSNLRCVYMRTGPGKAEAFLVSKTGAIQLTVDGSHVKTTVLADMVTIDPGELVVLREAIEKHYEQMET